MRRNFHRTGRHVHAPIEANQAKHDAAVARAEQMKLMRAQGKTYTEIAQAFGVSASVVNKLLRRYA